MDKKVDKQIALIFNGSDRPGTLDLMKYLVARTLRVHQDYEEKGKVYFAVDFNENIELNTETPADVIFFEDIDTEEAAEEARKFVSKANKIARFFVPLGSDFLTKDMVGITQSIFTYSLNDQRANICANRIQTLPDGSFSCDIVYQATPQGRKRGLRDKIFPTYNQNMFGKARVNSLSRDDVLKIIKAYAFGMALSVESKYISEALNDYVFPSFAKKREEEAKNSSLNERHFSREKDFDFD